jgi:hypothetical protein
MNIEDVKRALNHIIQMQRWVSSWPDRDEELLKNLFKTRVSLERRLSVLLSQSQ